MSASSHNSVSICSFPIILCSGSWQHPENVGSHINCATFHEELQIDDEALDEQCPSVAKHGPAAIKFKWYSGGSWAWTPSSLSLPSIIISISIFHSSSSFFILHFCNFPLFYRGFFTPYQTIFHLHAVFVKISSEPSQWTRKRSKTCGAN